MSRDRELVTAQVLAEALSLSVETIWRYTREKQIPYIELGKRQYRYRVAEVVGALSALREQGVAYQTRAKKEYTYQDYLELPEEPGYRFEILDGELVREPAPSVPHQRASRRLLRILEDHFQQTDPTGEVFGAPLDVTLYSTTVVQPDLFYVAGEQQVIVEHARVNGPPRLIVEVLSPTTTRKDRLKKMQIYQRANVVHYWLVNPEDRTLECFMLRDGLYTLVASGMDEDIVEHAGLEGLSVDLKVLWSGPGST